MKPGFTLIEVLLALVIVAIMGSMLFTALVQINSGARIADTLIDDSQRALIIHQQMEKDFMGVMVPVAAVFEEEEKNAQKGAPQTPPQTQNAKPPEKAVEPKAKEKPKVVTKVFFATNKETNLDTLTFITNNPLQVYWSEKIGKIKPRIARVVYRLVAEKDTKNVFKLMRQEGQDLYFDAYKSGGTKEIREFMLADNIKSFAISYHYIVEPKKDEKNKSSEKEKKEVKTVKEWNSDEKEQKEKRGGKQYPDWIAITCSVWDVARERSTEYEFKLHHPALGLPPTDKISELPIPGPQLEPPVNTQGKPNAAAPGSELDNLAKHIEAMLNGARNRRNIALGAGAPKVGTMQ